MTERRGAYLIVAATTIGLLGALPFLSDVGLVATLYSSDDNFYYLQIARNLAAGRGFTFDGIHATNGFHPLWQLLLVPIFGLLSGDVASLRAVAVVEAALISISAVTIYRLLIPRIGGAPALVAALLLVAQPGATRVLQAGMESSLLLCLLVIVWHRWLSLDGAEPVAWGRWLSLGGWCALAFLARLEAVVVLPALLLVGRRRFKADLKGAAALVAPTALCAAGYLCWNHLAFGTWLPISAMVKAHWARAGASFGLPPIREFLARSRIPWVGESVVRSLLGSPFSGSAVALGAYLALLAVVLLGAWRFRAAIGRAVRESGAAFVLFAGALVVVVDKAAVRDLTARQEVPILLATAVLGGALLARAPRLARAGALAALACTVARAPLLAWHGHALGGSTVPYALQAAEWLRLNTPTDTRVGSWNGGGMLGYFSHRHVVILDGLVNDLDFFQSVVKGGQLEGYLRREGVALLADPACGPEPPVSSALSRNLLSRPTTQSGGVAYEALANAYDLAASFYDADGPEGCPGYAIWRARWLAPRASRGP